MMKYYVGYKETNFSTDKYRIVEAFTEVESRTFTLGGIRNWEVMTEACFAKIQTDLNKNNRIYFNKSLTTPIIETNLEIQSAYNSLLVKKRAVRDNMRVFVANRSGNLLTYYMYSFTILNNTLMDKGYIITDENRESKYLEIVNTGNETVIQALDDYLFFKDQMDTAKGFYREFRLQLIQIDESTSVEEVEAKEQIFYDAYN